MESMASNRIPLLYDSDGCLTTVLRDMGLHSVIIFIVLSSRSSVRSHPAQQLHLSACTAIRTMNESDMDMESPDSAVTSSDSSDDDLIDQEAASDAATVVATLHQPL